MKKIQICSVFSIVTSLAIPFQAFAWGPMGHQTIAEVASKLTKNGNAFWVANLSNMGMLTNVPDNRWKSGSSAPIEKPLHFFQMDSYYSSVSDFDKFPHSYAEAVKQYTAPTLNQNGLAPWRVEQLFNLALAAFKAGKFELGLQMAGVMSHYIGDLSQPLHITKNYNGQETGDTGIHSFFESMNLAQLPIAELELQVAAKAQALLQDPQFLAQFSGTALDETFKEIDRTYPSKDLVIQTDLKEGRTGQGAADLLEIAKDCLANGTATLALILSQLWEQAGNSNASQVLSVTPPAWVAPNFTGESGHKFTLQN